MKSSSTAGQGEAWVVTSNGERFFLNRPDPALVDIQDIARTLARICRFNGRSKSFYSVAQHSVLVSEICRQDPLAGLLHDASEAYIGDLIRPVKDLLVGVREIEARISREIAGALGIRYARLVDPRVKYADSAALATEIRDLMPTWPEDARQLPPAVPRTIEPMGPDLACQAFLDRYERLSRADGMT